MAKPSVSVIFPFYGIFNSERLLASIESIKTQEDVNLEIIVSEQGPLTQFPNGIPGVKHIFTEHIPAPDLSDYHPGKVRNIGLKQCRGNYIYTNDSDIFFIRPNYLSNLIDYLEVNPNRVLNKPKMRRLPLDEFEVFSKKLSENGANYIQQNLDLSQPYIATLTGKSYPFKIITKTCNESIKTFTIPNNQFRAYVDNGENKGQEPKIFIEDLHCGANFLRKSQLDTISGYCEEYINWGCEDTDLQWKLSQLFELKLIPEEFQVLHLDHPKGYFSKEMWQKNETLFLERKNLGIQNILVRDSKIWNNN